MLPGCLQDFSRTFSGCSDGSCGPGGIWRLFQMKVWTLMIQRNSMIPNYLMIPAIWWSPAIRWSQTNQWSIGGMAFDNQKVYGDTSNTDGLVYLFITKTTCVEILGLLSLIHIFQLSLSKNLYLLLSTLWPLVLNYLGSPLLHTVQLRQRRVAPY